MGCPELAEGALAECGLAETDPSPPATAV